MRLLNHGRQVYPMTETAQIDIELKIPFEAKQQRLDRVLHDLLPDYSRQRIKQWLESRELLVDGQAAKASHKVKGGEQVTLHATLADTTRWQAQAMPIDIVYSDDSLLVVNKPAGLVVHPGAGNHDNTLINGLLHHYPELAQLPRSGIIHRIDKDTSGLLIVPRTLSAHGHLSAQLQDHSMARDYYALVEGTLIAGGTITGDIGRDPRHRTRMAVVNHGKAAVTHYRIGQRFRAHTLLAIQLETGRTHQIRVHMAKQHHPLIGDRLYGYKAKLPKAASPALIEALRQFPRQALHAYRLRCQHPVTQQACEWQIDLADDMQALCQLLSEDDDAHHTHHP